MKKLLILLLILVAGFMPIASAADTAPEPIKIAVCDMGFAGITITPEREKKVDFSQPFLNPV